MIFISGILILTLEKDWWGGYLGPDKNYTNTAANFKEWLRNGKRLTRPNGAYLIENSIRLIMVGTSITFFLFMCSLEGVQTVLSLSLAGKSLTVSFMQYLS